MVKKANVLFILFEGLADTVIDSQVLSHVSVMKTQEVADFEIWAFACDEQNFKKSLEKQEHAKKLSGVNVRVFQGVRPSAPFSLQRNARLIARALQETTQSFTHIHARTEYSAAVASYVKEIESLSLIWDCRGDAVAELDYRYRANTWKSKVAKSIRSAVFTDRLKRAGRACDKALFVSQLLKDRMQPYLGDKPTEIMPCCASETVFFFDEELRNSIRKELEIGSAQTLYIYSGSLAPYQRFDDTVLHFETVSRENPQARLLVLTPDISKAKDILEPKLSGKYILKHAQFSEINGYLNAADVAYMLRDPTPTNRVATPTKFAEYCLTGLPVIMNSAIEACYLMARDVGNYVDENAERQTFKMDRQSISAQHHARLSREGQIESYKRVYS